MEVLINNKTFFNNLKRIVQYEYDAKNIRKPSLANTYKNEPEFQKVLNLSCNYARTGQQKFKDPFAFHQRPNNFSYDGRKLAMLDTLKYNQKRDYPDVISKNYLKVVGFY